MEVVYETKKERSEGGEVTEESDEEGRARIIKLKYENALNMHVKVPAIDIYSRLRIWIVVVSTAG